MSRPVHIILNPTSGRGTGKRLRPEVSSELTRLGLEVSLEETERRGHAAELARAAALRGARRIVAAGGDGTVHEVVNGILQARLEGLQRLPALGIIPIGTGNDFVKSVNGGTDRRVAYQVIADGVVRHFDLGRVSWDGGIEYFMNGVGTGIDVEVVRQITKFPNLPGVISYLYGLMKAFVHFRPIPLRIVVDGEETDRSVMVAAVGNGFCLGGGFRLFPDALPDDGHLDICVIDRIGPLQVVDLLPRILTGNHGSHHKVMMRPARRVEFITDGEDPIVFQVDGELREPIAARRLEIEIVPSILPVLTGGPAHATLEDPQPVWAGQPAPQATI